MILAMPRPRPPHLHRQVTRHNKVVWYVRVDKGKRIRLRAEYGTDEFNAQYEAALEGRAAPKNGPPSGSLAWLLDQYRDTSAWRDLSLATRRQRENIFKHVINASGRKPFVRIKESDIVAGRDRRSTTPAQARNFLDAMRGLFRWAKSKGHVTVDPTQNVENPARPQSGGFPVWTEDDVEAYERKWPAGSRQRVWLHVMLYTGLRRGDAVTLGRQHVKDGVATLRTEKSQGAVTVTLPILPALSETLKAGPTGDLTFICGERGQPLTKESFGNMFSEACRAAGVQKSAHGVRKIGATRAADNGATEAELEAIFGWRGGGMASLYTRAANRARLAKAAMEKLSGTSIPSPDSEVRAKGQKP